MHLTKDYLVPKARSSYENITLGSVGTVRSRRPHLIEVVLEKKSLSHLISPEDLITCELSVAGEQMVSLLSETQKRNFLLGAETK